MSLHAEPNPCQVRWVKLNTSLERTSIASCQLWWCVWAEPLALFCSAVTPFVFCCDPRNRWTFWTYPATELWSSTLSPRSIPWAMGIFWVHWLNRIIHVDLLSLQDLLENECGKWYHTKLNSYLHGCKPMGMQNPPSSSMISHIFVGLLYGNDI